MPDVRQLTWREYFLYSAEYLPLTGGAGTAFTTFGIKIAKDATFEIRALTYRATDGRIFARFKEDATGRYLMTGDPDMRAIAGRPIGGNAMAPNTGEFQPFKWARPYRIPGGGTLTVEASDFSGASNTARISFHGTKIRTGVAPYLMQKYRYRVPFTYEIDLGTLAASGSATGVITIDQSSDFLCYQMTATRTGEASVLINESARGRDWMDRAAHIDNLAGVGYAPNNLPGLWDAPRFIEHGGNIAATVTDLSALANTVRLYFHGEQLYA